MPASRSRTDHWLDCLRKVHERGGALEITVDRGQDPANPPSGTDVVWRVRLLQLTESRLVVETPAAFGSPIRLEPGIALIGAITIGQNRWMFHTRTLGEAQVGRDRCLALEMPTNVERCTRRAFFRISTANLELPTVQCWPLIDPGSVIAAESANRGEIQELLASGPAPLAAEIPKPLLLPEVGPMFKAQLLNVSGGGLGLLVSPDDSAALSSRPYLWIRLDLRPTIPAPVAVTARIAHTHVDSAQNLYAGLAFDFAHDPAHRRFIVELFGRYVEALQRNQRRVEAA